MCVVEESVTFIISINNLENIPYKQLSESSFVVLLYFFLRLITEGAAGKMMARWPSAKPGNPSPLMVRGSRGGGCCLKVP